MGGSDAAGVRVRRAGVPAMARTAAADCGARGVGRYRADSGAPAPAHRGAVRTSEPGAAGRLGGLIRRPLGNRPPRAGDAKRAPAVPSVNSLKSRIVVCMSRPVWPRARSGRRCVRRSQHRFGSMLAVRICVRTSRRPLPRLTLNPPCSPGPASKRCEACGSHKRHSVNRGPCSCCLSSQHHRRTARPTRRAGAVQAFEPSERASLRFDSCLAHKNP